MRYSSAVPLRWMALGLATMVSAQALAATPPATPPPAFGWCTGVDVARQTLTLAKPVTKEVSVTELRTVVEKVTRNDEIVEVQKQVPITKVREVTEWVAVEHPWRDIQVHDLQNGPLTVQEAARRLDGGGPVLVARGEFPDRGYLKLCMPAIVVIVLPLAVAAPATGAAPAAPRPADPQPAASGDGDLTAAEAQVLKLTNAERAKVNLPPLKINAKLQTAAREYTKAMARLDQLGHSVDGTTILDRARNVGYQFSRLGENVAAGQRTPAEVVASWMASPGHRANLLSAEFTEIGIALAPARGGTRYWSQLFGAP